MQLQYITNEQGKQVGVLLDMASYRLLVTKQTADPELLTGLTLPELQALAHSKLAPEMESQLNDLLARQRENRLSAEEEIVLDNLLSEIDNLTILKTRARYTLKAQALLETNV